MGSLYSLELCSGAGGQALGLEDAGFEHQALVEIDPDCCQTLRLNRPHISLHQTDIEAFDGRPYKGVDVLAAGLPCPPFSIAGKQLGEKDERNLFPAAIRLVDEIRPRAVMIENVRGFLDAVFEDYRRCIREQLRKLGYATGWRLLNASDFGVPQLRPRVVIIALKEEYTESFAWPSPRNEAPPTVGETLYDLMAVNGWRGADTWKARAEDVAPTLVGGSKKHGGPDLGPTRAKRAWATLGVDGLGVADEPPSKDFVGMPRLTVRMCARLQGFPDSWQFAGRKTAAYRQVGNAFPPPMACAVATEIKTALTVKRAFSLRG